MHLLLTPFKLGSASITIYWLLVALLLGSPQAAACRQLENARQLLAQQDRDSATASYSSVWTAAQNEVWMTKQVTSGDFRGRLPIFWTNNRALADFVMMGTNPKTTGTLLIPGPKEAYSAEAAALCLTVEEHFDLFAQHPDIATAYLQSWFVPGASLHSSAFKDGMVLTTHHRPGAGQPYLNLTLSKQVVDGTSHWVFRNASRIRVPGTNSYEDVRLIPHKTDIRAGAAWMHLLDNWFRLDEFEPFWAAQRSAALQRAGLPPNNTHCPGLPGVAAAAHTSTGNPPQPASSHSSSLIIGLAVGGAGLVAVAGCALLLAKRHALRACISRKGSMLGLASTHASAKQSGGNLTHGPGTTKDPDIQPRSDFCSQFAAPLVAQTSCGYASASSAPASSSGLSSEAHSSPFAAFMAGQQHLPSSASLSEPLPEALSSFRVGTQQQQQQQQLLQASGQVSSPHGQVGSTSCGPSSSSSSRSGRLPVRPGSNPVQSAGGLRLPDLCVEATRLDRGPSEASTGAAYQSYEGGLLPTESVPMGQIPHALVVPFAELSLDQLIGTGAEGKVYRGTWKHTDIAAKEYLPHLPASESEGPPGSPLSDAAKANAQAALAKEVYWLTRLNHPNLVRFCAVCLERPLVVMEYCKNGSVFDIIRRAELEMKGAPQAQQACCSYLSWDRRLMMLHNVAAGMSYLHARSHIHGDLRSPNLFVGADGMVKVGDFGFTKRLAHNTSRLRVTRITHPRWVAPELLMENLLSPASDVYSFGVIMYELLTFRVPFHDLRKEQVVLEVMKGGRPEVPAEQELPPGTSSSTCLWSYLRLMEACWAQDPSHRPSFESIARRIKAMQRWRKLTGSLRHAGEAARRSHSMPVLRRIGPANGAAHLGAAAAANSAGDDEHYEAARRVVSAPSPAEPQQHQYQQQQQQQCWLAGAMRVELKRGVPQPQWMAPVLPQLPPALVEQCAPPHQTTGQCLAGADSSMEGVQPSAGQRQVAVNPAAALDGMLAAASSAVVQGTRLAVIPTCPHIDEQDALASVADRAQIEQARVLVVASDLPSRYDSGK